MFRSFLRSHLRKFGARLDYDVGYMEHLLQVDPGAFVKFYRVMGFAQHARAVPREAYYAAKIRAAMAEDCGPCTQLVVNMALAAGVSEPAVADVVLGNVGALNADTAMVVRFTEAVLAHDPAADEMREQIRARWGEQALVTLGFVISSAKIFPALKYTLGYGQACQRVQVADRTYAPQVPALQP